MLSKGLPRQLPAAAAALVAAAAGIMLWETVRYPPPTNLYPSGVLIGAGLLALGVAVQNLRHSARAPSSAEREAKVPVPLVRPLLFLVVWVAYPLAMVGIGFIAATVLSVGLSLTLLRIKHLVVWLPACLPLATFLLVVLQVSFNVAVPQASLDLAVTDFVYEL